MPGILFGRSSAKRIADVVREVERIPEGEQDLQRRRSGGLGRSTLWEVTAVQTGPGTVTIKRVSNIAFDLNDPSEKIDILYDPDNEPSVGDRGLLIRLGEGSLFFFKRAALNRINITSSCYVDDANPDTGGLGYPNSPIAYKIHTGFAAATIWRAVFKFERRCPLLSPLPDDIDVKLFLPVNSGLGVESFHPNAGDTVDVVGVVAGITEDFDPSTLTHNQLIALGTGGGTIFPLLYYRSAASFTSHALWNPDRSWPTRLGFYFEEGIDAFFTNEVYGFYVAIEYRSCPKRTDSFMRFTFNLVNHGPAWNGFLEWF